MKVAYILFKSNFENKLQSRLTNPSKTELGIISKNIIQNIVLNMQKTTNNNLWKNSTDTIVWLKNIKNKSKATFIQFDMIDFYPSISKEVLIDSIYYVKNYVEITDEQYQIILAWRKTVLANNDSTKIKTGLDNFDIPMGGYDSAQIADPVGLYILNTLSRTIDLIQIGKGNAFRASRQASENLELFKKLDPCAQFQWERISSAVQLRRTAPHRTAR